MKIIISPAKKMNQQMDVITYKTMPTYLRQANKLREYLKTLSLRELQKLLVCNDNIAKQNFDRFQEMNLDKSLTPALLAYKGIQYQYMSPQVFTDSEWSYVEHSLRIISGMYGILRPLDGVVPYRLEMQAKINNYICNNLYEYWNDSIFKELTRDNDLIINLASKEYSKVIEPYLSEQVEFISCIFGNIIDGKVKVKATEAKMARGEMVRYLAVNEIQDIEKVKEFKGLGFEFNEVYSTNTQLVFIRSLKD